MEPLELDTPLAGEMVGDWVSVALANDPGEEEVVVKVSHSGSVPGDPELAELGLVLMEAVQEAGAGFISGSWDSGREGAAILVIERLGDGSLRLQLVSDAPGETPGRNFSPAQALGSCIHEALKARLDELGFDIAEASERWREP